MSISKLSNKQRDAWARGLTSTTSKEQLFTLLDAYLKTDEHRKIRNARIKGFEDTCGGFCIGIAFECRDDLLDEPTNYYPRSKAAYEKRIKQLSKWLDEYKAKSDKPETVEFTPCGVGLPVSRKQHRELPVRNFGQNKTPSERRGNELFATVQLVEDEPTLTDGNQRYYLAVAIHQKDPLQTSSRFRDGRPPCLLHRQT